MCFDELPRLETLEPEVGQCGTPDRVFRDQSDEFAVARRGPDSLGLGTNPRHDLRGTNHCGLLQVHRDLGGPLLDERQAEGADAGQPTSALANARSDNPRLGQPAVLKGDVPRDERTAYADEGDTSRRVCVVRAEVGLFVSSIEPSGHALEATVAKLVRP